MKPKILMVLLISVFIYQSSYSQTPIQQAAVPIYQKNVHIPSYTDSDLKQRLNEMVNTVVKPHFNTIVKSYVNTYTLKRRDKTEAMLGRMALYFPIFEEYLRSEGLPQDLKYLPILESALNPHALSRSGAAGLWQFMPATAIENGLRIDSYVDERCDPHKSTKAALKYLYKQYKRYGDWSLALAAYNGGPGRVNRAIKRGRSKNFWRIKSYLPKETRNYVSAFTAANYIATYYSSHNLSPIYPDIELQVTDKVKIYNKMDFQEIARITGTPMYIIEYLNPGYKKQMLPTNRSGNNLILPKNEMAIFKRYLKIPDSKPQASLASPLAGLNPNQEYITVTYTVKPGDNLNEISYNYGVDIQNLKSWNQLISSHIRPGQSLLIYIRKLDAEKNVAITPLPSIPIRLDDMQKKLEEVRLSKLKTRVLSKFTNAKKGKKQKYIYYQIKRRETLMDVVKKFPDTTVEELIELNDLRKKRKLKPGSKIIIKKL